MLFALLSQRKLQSEQGLAPLYEAWCGGFRKFGFTITAGTAVPVWRISLYDEFFVIAAVSTMLTYYPDVVNIEYQRKFGLNRIEIQGRKPEFYVILYLRSPKRLAELFRSKGVPVVGLP